MQPPWWAGTPQSVAGWRGCFTAAHSKVGPKQKVTLLFIFFGWKMDPGGTGGGLGAVRCGHRAIAVLHLLPLLLRAQRTLSKETSPGVRLVLLGHLSSPGLSHWWFLLPEPR